MTSREDTMSEHTKGTWLAHGIRPSELRDGVLDVHYDQPYERWVIRTVEDLPDGGRLHRFIAELTHSGTMADTECEANARHIVHCVNSYPVLVEALEQIEREMRAGFGSSFGETREQVRRALRLAKQEERP